MNPESSDDALPAIRPKRWPWVLGGLVVVGAVGLANFPRHTPSVPDLFGQSTWTPSHKSALSQVDLVLVHERLLPAWGIAAANPELDGAAEAESRAAAALASAIAADKNLSEIFERLRAASGDPVANAQTMIDLTEQWSGYLDSQNAPFLVQGNVITTRSGGFFYLKAYHVHRDLQLRIGQETVRAREVSRLDRTNIVENYLGATAPGQVDATVVLDRLSEFALERIWPLLASQETTPLGQRVVAEVRANLDRHHLRVLEATAMDRRRLQQALDAIAQRADCGSTFTIRSVGYAGLPDRELEILDRLAAQSEGHPCPDILPHEADAIRKVSQTLAGEEGLDAAVRGLVGLLGANVAVHEARHVVDDRLVDGLREPMACATCPPNMSTMAIAEMSAYLASMAWGPAPYTAFFQACDATEGQGGPHGRAMEVIMDRLRTFCGEAPGDLAAHAAKLETDLLGRSERVEILPEK